MSGVGKAWRIIGLLLALAVYVAGLIDGRFWVLAAVSMAGLAIFLVSWLVAASSLLSVSRRPPNVRKEWGPGATIK